MRPKIRYRALVALMLCVTFCIPSAAFSLATGQKYIAAINTDLFTNSKTTASYSLQAPPDVYNVYQDPLTGKTMTELAPNLPEVEPLAVRAVPQNAQPAEQPRFDYVAGESSRSVQCRKGSSYLSYEMHCLYTGTYCTVWGTEADDEKVRISAENAAIVGAEFDSQYPKMIHLFGDYAYDADGDGKIAILCYDIDGDYEKGNNSTYIAGYFWMADLIDSSGCIGGKPIAGDVANSLDCIHVDTYPGMGTLPFHNVSQCFGTLCHEFQHMLNFASRILTGEIRTKMPTFLDEAFSMAAEHMICGENKVSNRVSYFNSGAYTPGTSLTSWSNTFNHYSNSYLFGQYIRTRYAQLGHDGGTIYKQVIEQHRQTDRDCLQIIAELLGESQQELVCNFWLAIALKQPSGAYGFGGEAWANRINAKLSTASGKIYNGGARFYRVTELPENLQSENLTLICFNQNGPIPSLQLSAQKDSLSVHLELLYPAQTEQSVTVFVVFSDPQTGQTKSIASRTVTPCSQDLSFAAPAGGESYLAKVILTDAASTPLCPAAAAQWSKPGGNELPEIDIG